ncbi:MAG: flagellar assembly protein H, partial [Cyanobacteria bacterium M5B4]
MYDNTCKYLAEAFPADFATWLIGKPIDLSKLEPSELSNQPIRADSVIFLQSRDTILHLEFQTNPDANMPLRMLNYWIRLHIKYPDKLIHQTVIYLRETKSTLVDQTQFQYQRTTHEFNVIKLWEQSPEIFQEYLGLLPLAVLTNTTNPTAILRNVANKISTISDPKLKSDLETHTFIIAGLVLEARIVQQLLRRDAMKESSTYQLLRREAMEKVERK